jgi:hypothetical protein
MRALSGKRATCHHVQTVRREALHLAPNHGLSFLYFPLGLVRVELLVVDLPGRQGV